MHDELDHQVGSRDNGSWPTARRFGFRFGRVDDLRVGGAPPPKYVSYAALVPHWLPIVLLSLPPLRGLWLLRRRLVRAERGLCLSCGYDLRGCSSPGGRCPECGAGPTTGGAGAAVPAYHAGG